MPAIGVFVLITLLTGRLAWAHGYKNPDQGTRALGQADAFVAQADDPSAVYYNPAGLVNVRGTQISSGGELIRPWTSCKTPAGTDEHIDPSFPLLPNVYVTSDLGSEYLALGLGVNVPYGLATRWGDTSFAQYVTTYSSMSTFNVSPVVAMRINDNLSVGGGLNIYIVDLTLERNLNFAALGVPGFPGGTSALDLSGTGLGYNAGALLKINDRHSVGASFKSYTKVKTSGTASFSQIPAPLQAFYSIGPVLTTNSRAVVKFPWEVTVGYAFRPIPRLKLEGDVNWMGWSVIDQDYVEFDCPLVSQLMQTTEDKNWRDCGMYNLGAEYQATDALTVRCGAGYSSTPIPESTFKPDLPQSDKFITTIGLSYTIERWTFDIACGGVFSVLRNIDNDVGAASGTSIDGKYRSATALFSAGVTYAF